jgi:hypothetical protein
VHANGDFDGELEMIKACIDGSLDLAVTASNVAADIVPELGLRTRVTPSRLSAPPRKRCRSRSSMMRCALAASRRRKIRYRPLSR